MTAQGTVPGPLLRPWGPDDAPRLRDAFVSTPDLVTQFGEAVPSTLDVAHTFIASSLPFGDAARNWAITVDGRAVGNVGASHIERRHGTAWLSYWLSADARGHGLATRALASVVRWAFADGLFRLELGHRVNNPASCAVARRAGFLPEGIERQKLRYGTERFDVELHARLAVDPSPVIEPLPMTPV